MDDRELAGRLDEIKQVLIDLVNIMTEEVEEFDKNLKEENNGREKDEDGEKGNIFPK